MKGLVVSNSINWRCAQAMLAERNPHLYLQYALLGLDTNIEAHIVVPTQYSLLYSEERTLALCRIWQQHSPQLGAARMEVMQKQERCLTCCAMCSAELAYSARLPYQMALRIVAGPDAASATPMPTPKPTTWSYDVLLGMLCRRCQTAPWHTLLPTTLAVYPAICLLLARLAFASPLDHHVDDDGDMCLQYLQRIDALNDHCSTVVATTHNARCAHCGQHKRHRELTPCPWGCACVDYCRGGACQEAAAYYHPEGLCVALKEGHLFHVTHAVIVDITGATYKAFGGGGDDDTTTSATAMSDGKDDGFC